MLVVRELYSNLFCSLSTCHPFPCPPCFPSPTVLGSTYTIWEVLLRELNPGEALKSWTPFSGTTGERIPLQVWLMHTHTNTHANSDLHKEHRRQYDSYKRINKIVETYLHAHTFHFLFLRVCSGTLERGLVLWLPVSEWLQPTHDTADTPSPTQHGGHLWHAPPLSPWNLYSGTGAGGMEDPYTHTYTYHSLSPYTNTPFSYSHVPVCLGTFCHQTVSGNIKTDVCLCMNPVCLCKRKGLFSCWTMRCWKVSQLTWSTAGSSISLLPCAFSTWTSRESWSLLLSR